MGLFSGICSQVCPKGNHKYCLQYQCDLKELNMSGIFQLTAVILSDA